MLIFALLTSNTLLDLARSSKSHFQFKLKHFRIIPFSFFANFLFRSPNYPSNYPGNTDCTNRIGTASDGVTFEIDAFDTETNYDEVTFVNANNELYTFTGYSVCLIKIF